MDGERARRRSGGCPPRSLRPACATPPPTPAGRAGAPAARAARVDELLLAGVARVTRRADLHVELGLRRARRERVPARAAHGREDVLGMNIGLHREARIPDATSGPTL